MITDMRTHPKIASGRCGVDASRGSDLLRAHPLVFWSCEVAFPDWVLYQEACVFMEDRA